MHQVVYQNTKIQAQLTIDTAKLEIAMPIEDDNELKIEEENERRQKQTISVY